MSVTADDITAPGPDGAAAPPRRWKDPKRRWWLLGLVVPLLPLGARDLVSLTGSSLGWWLGVFWIVALIPLLDAVFGEDRSNPPEWAVQSLTDDRYYRWCTYLFLPLQYFGLVAATHIVATRDLNWFEWLGFSLTVGTVAGVAINTAHELGHKSDRVERALARVALAQSGYGHFYIEHNRGHHNRVATPEDPASSRLGESLYEFLPRTVIGSLRSAWELEAKGLRHRGQRVIGPHNGILVSWSLTVALFASLTAWFGWKVLPFLVAQAVFGFLLLEVVNYVEHYGLLRQKTETGRYERCRPEHSWNSNHIGSNLVLYNLERHSDHHAHPTRRYQALRHFDEAPQLPNGYGGMITLATIPPLWRRVMDHRVLALYDGDASRANLHPRVRERLLARYGRG
ncbi:MAG: alkane 1-monooxygenase [Microthrixaceae bacterium]